ncbi:hypothetical protein L7F22_050949 [Adiantum nelumboides]|nr:hypothetical protein [Adiantum nelumboides]
MGASSGICWRCFHGTRLRPCYPLSLTLLIHRRLGTLQCASSYTQDLSHETILSLSRNDQLDDALHVLANTRTGLSDNAYVSLLNICIKKKALFAAKKVAAHVESQRTELSGLLGDSLVITLARCGGVNDAWKLHCTLRRRTVSSWSALICGFVGCGKWQEALQMYLSMLEDGYQPDRYAYVSLFKACGSIPNLEVGRELLNEVKQKGLVSDVYIANSILSMHGKGGNMEEVESCFMEMKHRNVVSWNAMLTSYIEHGEPKQALLLFRQMHQEGVESNELTFVMAIKACCNKEEEEFDGFDVGQALHADAHKKGFTLHLLVASTLMCMYSKYCDVAKAEGVFSRLSQHNVVTWTTMLKSYVEQGQGRRVLLGYGQLLKEGFRLDAQAYVLFFQACCSLVDEREDALGGAQLFKTHILEIGRALHEDAKQRGFALDAYVGGILVSMYGKCGSIVDAEKVFNGLSQQDVVSWNVMLSAYIDQCLVDEALILFGRMVDAGIILDERTSVSTLQACIIGIEHGDESAVGVEQFVAFGQTLYMDVCKLGFTANVFVGNTVINFYGKCRKVLEAEKVFILCSKHNITTWNVMLCVYLEQGCGELIMQLFRQLIEEGVSPDERTFVTTLQACSIFIDTHEAMSRMDLRKSISLEIVRAFHADAKKEGFSLQVFVANSLITSYAKCGALKEAELVFTSLSGSSIVSWNAMLSAYIEQGNGNLALQLFTHMLQVGANPDPQTFVIVLQASGALEEKQDEVAQELSTSFHIGEALHNEARERGLTTNVFVGNTLTRMYGKHGRLENAVDVFGGICERNIVSWNAMLSGLAEQGDGDLALQLFREMQKQGVPANDITLVCILQACSETGLIEVCRHVHFAAGCSGLDQSAFVATTIIHAYGCCGGMVDCQAVFDGMHQPRTESWNSMLTAVAGEGNLVASLDSFEEMHSRDTQPSRFTFIALLMACSHTGLVGSGLELFLYMIRRCGLCAESKHYVIMVDLLGRAGDFGKVESVLSRMPVQPDLAFWLSLLSACRVHGHVELGKQAYDSALQLQPNDAAVYVGMSNIYADARRIAYVNVMEKG